MIARGVTPILNVSDVTESVAWFEKLGWNKGFQWGDPPGFGSVWSGEFSIFFCKDGQGSRGKSDLPMTFGSEGEHTKGQGTWMTVWVDDDDAIHNLAIEQGLEVTWPPTDMEWNVREMHLRHPDGHVLRISKSLEEVPEEASS